MPDAPQPDPSNPREFYDAIQALPGWSSEGDEYAYPEPTPEEVRAAIDSVRDGVDADADVIEIPTGSVYLVGIGEVLNLQVPAGLSEEATELFERLRRTVIFRDGQVKGMVAGERRRRQESGWPDDVTNELFRIEAKYLSTEAWPDVKFLLELNNRQFALAKDTRALLVKVKEALAEARKELKLAPEDAFGLPANEWDDEARQWDEARQAARDELAKALAAADYPALAAEVDAEAFQGMEDDL